MYKNRSPNLTIVLIFLFSLLLPVNSSRAVTNQTETEEPLTVEFCKNFLEETEKETDALDDPLLLEKQKTCETMLEEAEIKETAPQNEPTVPDGPTSEEATPEELDEEVISTPESEKEEPVSPPTPESESETAPALPTSESESKTTSAPPTSESENEESPDSIKSPTLETGETTKKKSKTPLLLEQQGVADVTLVSSVNMTAAYDALQKNITLTADLKSVLNVGVGSKYMVFELPPEIMQSILKETITLEYYYTVLLGERKKNIPFNSIQQSGNKIYAEVGSDLALSSLTKDIFVLNFKIGQLPVSKDSKYVFRSSLTSSVVDLSLLSKGVGTATLEIAPVFSLVVPQLLDFGTHQIKGGEEIINRQTAMTIEIGHQNALNYDWKLRAKLTKPLTATNNELNTLENALIFKGGTVSQVLQTIDSEIASGKMGTASTVLTYGPNEGILIDVTKQRPRSATYETTIQWTLVNAP